MRWYEIYSRNENVKNAFFSPQGLVQRPRRRSYLYYTCVDVRGRVRVKICKILLPRELVFPLFALLLYDKLVRKHRGTARALSSYVCRLFVSVYVLGARAPDRRTMLIRLVGNTCRYTRSATHLRSTAKCVCLTKTYTRFELNNILCVLYDEGARG